MDIAQKKLLKTSLDEMRMSQLKDANLSGGLADADLVHGSLDLISRQITGFTSRGATAIGNLARSLRLASLTAQRRASTATVSRVIASEIIARWKGRTYESLTADELETFDKVLVEWFEKQDRVRTHAVPCTITPFYSEPFSVGPTRFVHMHDFPPKTMGLPEDFPKNDPLGAALIDFGRQHWAPWIAVVAVPGREEKQSVRTADIAVDIALAILQLTVGPDLRRISRATARSGPLWRVDWHLTDEQIGGGTSNQEPARSLSQPVFAGILEKYQPALSGMGRRLEDFLAGTSAVASLDESWCNAAYWYHQALGEDLETVAIAKLETCMEVLLSAESTSGSTRRLLEAFSALWGLSRDDTVGDDPSDCITAGQMVDSIVTARSRILHGTWPTLGTDMPSAKGKGPCSFALAEMLAKRLLVDTSAYLDAYVEAGGKDCPISDFLFWVQNNRDPT